MTKAKNKLLRKILICLLAIILIPILILIIILTFVNPNHYKSQLTSLLSNATHREITIDGDLSWSLFPFGITLNDFKIANDPKFLKSEKNLVEAKSATVSLELIPLFKKIYKINSISLDTSTINLFKDKSNYNNWQSMLSDKSADNKLVNSEIAKSSDRTASDLSALSILFITKINITNSTINWEEPNERIIIKDINFSSKNITLNKPFDIDGKFNSNIQSLQTTLFTDFNLTLKFQTLNDINIDINRLHLRLGGKKYPKNPDIFFKAKSNVDLAQKTFTLSKLDTDLNGLIISGDLNGTYDYKIPHLNGKLIIKQSNLNSFLNNLNYDFSKDFYQTISGKFEFNTKDKIINLKPLDITLDEDHLTGFINIDSNKWPYAINAELNSDSLNFDKLLMKGSGKKPTYLTKVNSNIKFADQKLKTNSTFTIYNGEAKHNNTLDLSKDISNWQGNFTISHLNVATFLHEKLQSKRFSGDSDITLDYNTSGKEAPQLINNLNGNLKINLAHGYLNGADLNNILTSINNKLDLNPTKILDLAKNILDTLIMRADDNSNIKTNTPILDLKASAKITNGIVSNQDLSADTPYVTAHGSGDIYLSKQTINYKIVLIDKKNKNNFNVPILITGDLSHPNYAIDTVGLLNSDLFKSLLNKNINSINKKLKLDDVPVLKNFLEKL